MSAQPLTDASAVLTTRFVGDLSSLEAASRTAPEIVSRSADRINQVLSKPGGFSNLATAAQQSATVVGAQMNSMTNSVQTFSQSSQGAMSQAAQGINSSFSVVGTGVQSSMTTATTATQQAAASMQTNLSQVANAAATVPPALTNISTTAQTAGQGIASGMGAAVAPIAAIGTAGSQAGAQASAGLNSIATAAQTPAQALRQLEGAFNSNQSAIVNLSGQIANNRSQMAQLSAQMTDLTLSGQKYVEVTNAQGKTSQVLSGEFTNLRNQYMQLGSQTRVLSAEQGTYRAANQAVAQSIEVTSEKTGFLTKLLGTKTNMVSTAGTAFMGYDRVLQTGLASIGGVSLAVSLLITALGFLIPKIISAASETDKKIKIDKEAVATNALLAQSMQSQVSLGPVLADVTTAQTIANTDLITTIISVADEQRVLARLNSDLEKAQRSLQIATTASDEVIHQHGQTTESWARLTIKARDAVVDANTALQEQRAEIAPNVAALQTLQSVYGLSTDRVVELAAQMGYGDEVLQGLRATVDSNATAMQRLAGALEGMSNRMLDATVVATNLRLTLQQIKAPTFDVSATVEGLKNLETTAIAGAEAALKQFGFTADRFEANRKNLEPLNKALERNAALNAQGATQAARNADAQRLYRESLSGLHAELQTGIKVLDLTDKTLKAFSDTVKKAKQTITESSPLITERAIAGSPEAVKSVVERFVDTIVNELNTNKDRVGEVGDSIAAIFINRFEASLGKDAKTPIFAGVIKSLREAAPELDAVMSEAMSHLRSLVEEVGVSLGEAGLKSEQTMRSIIDSLRKQVGITDAIWKGLDKSQKEVLDEGFQRVAEVYISHLQTIEQKTQATTTRLKNDAEIQARASKIVFDAWIAGAITTSEAIAQMGGVVHKAMGEIVHDFFEVEIAVKSLADQTDLQLKKINESLKKNFIFQQDRFESESRDAIENVISFYERLGEQLGLTGDALDHFVNQKSRTVLSQLEGINKEAIDGVIKQHERLKVKLPGIWDEVFKDASASTRKNVDDILRIIDLIPGRVGDSLRKTESEFRRWYEMIDRTIRLIERALGEKETEGLSGVITNLGKLLGGIFKKAQAQTNADAKAWEDDIAGVLGGMSGSAGEAGGESGKSFSSGFLGALPGIASGLATFFGSRGQGRLAGVVGGALGGMQVGASIGGMFGPVGAAWGAGIGAAAGGILGLFGTGGPSEEEKRAAEQARKDEIERIRQDLAKGYQELQQAVLETASRAHALLESIIGRARVPKAEIKAFVKDMTVLLKELVRELATIPKEVTDEIKVTSENLAPAAELMAAMPQVFEGINQHMPMAESQARLFVNDWGLLTNLIGELAEDTPNKLEKQMRKFANRMMPVAELTITVSEGINAVLKTRPVSVAQFKTWAGNIDIILVEVSALEEKFDRYGVRKAGVFAENATKIFNFLTEGSAAVNSVGDIAVITASDLAPFSNGINLIVVTVSDLSRTVNSELVVEAQRFSQGAGASVTFMLETAKGFQELKDIDTVIPDTLRAVGEGVKLAVVIMAQVSREVDQDMRDDAEEFSASIGSVFTVITSAASAFADASATRTLYPATMRAIGDGIKLAIVELARANREVSSEMRAEADAFAGGVTNIVTVIGTAGNAMIDLEPGRFNVNGLIMLIGNIEEATRRTITLAKSIDKSDLALAVEFSVNAQKIFDSTASGIEIQKNMAELAPVSISQWDNFVLNVSQQTTALARSVEVTRQGLDLSAEFRANTDGIRENVEAALENILATAAAAAGFLANSASYSFSIQSQGLQASTLAASAPVSSSAPLPSPGSSGGGNTYNVYVTNNGNVITERQFKDSVIDAIEEDRQRATPR